MKFVTPRRAGAALLVTAVGAGSVAAGVASAGGNLTLGSKKQGVSFTKKSLTTTSGRVTITLTVPSGSQFPHAIAIRGGGVNRRGRVVARGTSRVTANLRAGRYTFYCPVGQHAANGMRGRLTVN